MSPWIKVGMETCESMLISVAMLSRKWDVTNCSVVCGILVYYWWWWNWEPVSDGGGHLALVLMLTLLHGRLRLPICKTGFYFGFWVRQKTPTLSDGSKILEKIRQRAHGSWDALCASSDATFYPGMHGLTQDEGIISSHTCASEDDCSRDVTRAISIKRRGAPSKDD